MVEEHSGYIVIVITITPLHLFLTAKQTLTPGLYDEYLPLSLYSVGRLLLVPDNCVPTHRLGQVGVLYYTETGFKFMKLIL